MNSNRGKLDRTNSPNGIVRRVVATGLLVVVSLGAGASALRAQSTNYRAAVRPFVGAYVPTGDQRDFVKPAVLAGAQASMAFNDNFALTGSFGWTPSKDKVTAGDQTLDQFQYDVGVEARSMKSTHASPFVGLGVGGRTYKYRDLDISSKSDFDGYGALGVDVGWRPIGVRVEGRDYVSRFDPLSGGGGTKTRNDLMFFVGFGLRL